MTELTGERVLLRRWVAADAADVYRICQDPEIQRWATVPVPYAPSDADSFVGPVSAQLWDSGTGAAFAAVDRAGGALSGSMTVLRFAEGTASVGYWTAASMRGAGRTGEALRLLTAWCFAERDCARVEASIDVRNVASTRVAESAGFLLEGVLRSRMVHRGRRIDTAMYSRLSTDPP